MTAAPGGELERAAAERHPAAVSRPPTARDQFKDIVGVYLDPPERAFVLCGDQNFPIQALDWAQPILPLVAGTPKRRGHGSVRRRTANPFAVADMRTSKVIESIRRRHRAAEFKKFLERIDTAVPEGLDVHVMLDNYSTNNSPAIHRWLLRHPRFHLHFTPTSSFWLNMVERWFSKSTNKRLGRGAHRSAPELERDIRNWIEHWNQKARPYVWVMPAGQIHDSVDPT